MTAQEKAVAWKQIESICNKIIDPVLKKSILGELAGRAKQEWGFCPSEKNIKISVRLEEWEQSLLDSIKISEQYGVMILQDEEYSKMIHNDNIKWMLEYIRRGGDYRDLPDDVKNEYTLKIYNQALLNYGEEIEERTKHFF